MNPTQLHGLRVYAAAPRPRENWSRQWRACLALTVVALAACAWAPINEARQYSPRWMTVEATAYCPGACCTDGDGRTATMRDARRPGVAVDPAVIALGSRLDIPGYPRGWWTLADDTGRLVRGARIDVRMETHSEAKAFGTRTLRVRIWSRR